MPTNLKPWERGAYDAEVDSRESSPAYEALQIYLRLGGGRSYQKVATELSKSLQLVSRWASRWFWRERALAYDVHMNAVEERVVEDARRRSVETWLERLEKVDDDEHRVGSELVGIVESFREKIERLPVIKTEVNQNGQTVVVMPIPPAILSALASLVRAGSDIRRQAVISALARHGIEISSNGLPQPSPGDAPLPALIIEGAEE